MKSPIAGMSDVNRDFVIAVSVSFVIFTGFHLFDAFEGIYFLTRQYENWELDEFILLLLAIPLPASWFAYRRARETRRESSRRIELEKALAHFRKLESLGTLAGGVAHELNNQLLPVMIMSELVRDHLAEDDPDHRKMELVIAAASTAKRTVSKILNFSRGSEDPPGVCELAGVFGSLEGVLKASCPANVRLAIETDGRTRAVRLSKDDLQGVIVNLFSNAVDALGGKQGDISVMLSDEELTGNSVAPELPAGQYARITIRDTGRGIESKVLERIFDPFFTTKVVGQGTGMGLAIVFKVVQRAGGGIVVKTERGQGSTFTVYLPLEEHSQ